jgi:imidazole glycerol-phosphate synthase subunit HisH
MTGNRVVVVDFGMGNLRSVAKAVERVAPEARVIVSDDPAVVRSATRVIMPGQGAIGTYVEAVRRTGLEDALREAIAERPCLGICLGLEVLYRFSEEDGGVECLGVLDGRVRHLRSWWAETGWTGAEKVPHMGWNCVRQARAHPLWEGIDDGERFYFVHSYCALAQPGHREAVGVSEYGVPITAAAARGNVFATQFHPEKSQRAGLRLLANFVAWDGDERAGVLT